MKRLALALSPQRSSLSAARAADPLRAPPSIRHRLPSPSRCSSRVSGMPYCSWFRGAGQRHSAQGRQLGKPSQVEQGSGSEKEAPNGGLKKRNPKELAAAGEACKTAETLPFQLSMGAPLRTAR